MDLLLEADKVELDSSCEKSDKKEEEQNRNEHGNE